MADERTLFAGDMTSDQLGRTIRVKVSKHVTVEDEVEAVGHVDVAGTYKTLVVFKDTTPENMGEDVISGLMASLHRKSGFLLGRTDHVQVLP